MKKIIKALLLDSLVIGMATGCDFGGKKSSQEESRSSSDVSSVVSSIVSSSEETTSSNSSSEKSSSSSSSAASSSNSSSSAASSSSASSSSSTPLPAVPTGITLDTTYVKKTYEQGEALDLTGLVVTVSYNDNTTKVAENYTSNPAQGTVLNEIGNKEITITVLTFSKTFTVKVEKAEKRDWTTDEAKTMSDHLYGVVLPYTGFEESVVTYNAQYDTVYIQGGDSTDGTLEAYARAMSSLGFILVSNSGSYSFRKTVTTDAGERYLRVVYYTDEDDQFYLEAYDPYYYTFPTQLAGALAYALFGSDEVVPAYNDADRYQIDVQQSAIYCYTSSTTSEADYTAILNEAGWDTTGGYDAEQGFYTAVAPNKTYMIYYHYEGSPYFSLDIYLLPVNFWNDEPVNAFYAKYTDYTVDIPALNVAGANYLFQESELNEPAYATGQIEYIHAFYYIIGGTQTDLARYATILVNAGWDISGSGTYYTAKYELENKGLVRIEFSYDKTVGVIVTFYAKLDPFPGTYWPAVDVANALGSDITDVLPAFEGEAKSYTYIPANSWGGDLVWVAVEEGTEQACLTAYKATLVEKGYTLSEGGGLYYSPNHQIRVMVYINEPGTFSIEFAAGPFLQWPAARLARLISEMLHTNVTDTLPAFNDGVEYSFDLYDEGLYLCIELDEDDDVADAVEAYSALLLREGFSEAGEDSDGDMHYLSPLKQFDVCPYEDDDFYLFIPNTAEELEWPLETINSYLSMKGWKDPLPEYEGNYTAIEASVDALGMFYVDITLDNPLVAVAEYCKLLKDEGWELDLDEEDNVGGSTYISPSKEYSAWVCPHTGGFAITLDEAPKDPVTGAEFPMDEILACFPDAAGLVPTINNATSFESYGVEGYCDFEAYFEDEQTAAKAYTDYVAALVGLGYSVETFYGNVKKYVAPNGKYYIAVYDESEEYNAIYVEFYTNN